MTTLELIKNIGMIADWNDGSGLKYEVKITDSRLRWGSVDYLIAPVAGSGTRWVSGESVKLRERKPTYKI
jgi:hypothetical protein